MSIEMTSESPSLSQTLSTGQALGGYGPPVRSKQLKTARAVLIIVGTLTILFNALFLVGTEAAVNEEVQKQVEVLHDKGMVATPSTVARFRNSLASSCYLTYGSPIAVGAVLIVLGLMVPAYPVSVTVSGLVLYIGTTAIFGYLNPETVLPGTMIQNSISVAGRTIIAIALLIAIRAAVSHRSARGSSPG